MLQQKVRSRKVKLILRFSLVMFLCFVILTHGHGALAKKSVVDGDKVALIREGKANPVYSIEEIGLFVSVLGLGITLYFAHNSRLEKEREKWEERLLEEVGSLEALVEKSNEAIQQALTKVAVNEANVEQHEEEIQEMQEKIEEIRERMAKV